MSQLPDEPQGKPLFLNPEAAEKSEYEPSPLQNAEPPPKFQSAADPQPPPQVDEFPEELDPIVGRALRPRHKELARMHAMGKSNNEICAKLNYSQSRVSILVRSPMIQKEVARYQDRLFESDVHQRMKDLGQDAVDVIEELMRDPTTPPIKKVAAAQWLIEKLTGKAKQEHTVESSTLAGFMEMLKGMEQRGESLEPIDVTPQQAAAEGGAKQIPAPAPPSGESKFTDWVDKEL